MGKEVRDAVASLYEPHHVGATTVRDVLVAGCLEQIRSVFQTNAERFYPLKFGNVTRWDLTEEDFQKNPTLEHGRRQFRFVCDLVSASTTINPVYQEKFSVMFYPKGSPGVKPHRDSEHSVNCVVIFVISGNSSFFVARDKECKDVTECQTNPGDAIVMRGPRSVDDELPRPIHYVDAVTDPRFVMICRHINLEGLKK